MESVLGRADFFSSSAEYRDYGGGYKIDCYSALGLLGLLGLLEILRDLVEDVTDMRRRRSVPSLISFGNSGGILSSLRSEIPEDILQSFPGILMPLLHVVADVNDQVLRPECLELALCKSNQALIHPIKVSNASYSENRVDNDGIFGLKDKTRRKAAQLMTEVLSKAFFSHFSDDLNSDKTNKSLYARALLAGEIGRNNINCEEKFKNCWMEPQYHPQPNFPRDCSMKSN